VLARDAIAVERYEDFRQRLRDLAVIQFDDKPGYVAFLYDGMVDGQEGYLRVKPGASSPAMPAKLFGAAVIRPRPDRRRLVPVRDVVTCGVREPAHRDDQRRAVSAPLFAVIVRT
jgi:hypothetical protein